MGDSQSAIHDGGRQERAGSRPARGSAEHRAADVGGARTGEREAGVNYTRRARFFAALVPLLAVLVASLQGCAATPAAKADGEPIPLNSTDPRFSGYFSQVRKMIHEKWAYPCVQNATTGECEYKAASLTIQFALLQDGRVTDVRVTKNAEWQVYDDVAAQALRMAAPFPPVPYALMATAKPGSAGVVIVATFFYVLNAQPSPDPPR